LRPTERIGLSALHRLDPERAHALSLQALRLGLAPLAGVITSARLACSLAGMGLVNPIGLAAGYDKNAVAIGALCRAGFGFVEVGAATPRPQAGNAKPRLFRLTEDRAAINRFGFNNEGAEAIAARLAVRPAGPIPVGINLGANKDSAERGADFARVLAVCGPHVDFATVNVSSPNTEKLRDLQGSAALTALLADVMRTRATLPRAIPIFLKIAPDLHTEEIAEIGEVALQSGLSGIIATNTTLSRESLKSANSGQMGGLSGAPLFEKSTRVLAELSKATKGSIPLIGVGGISSAEDAFQKILAGASAVQIYTAMVFQGISMIAEVAQGLDDRLAQAGFANVSQAVGTGRDRWL
jgi:dihydroorotate dehydrogenase